jgi:hypothetical protein
MTRPRLQLHLSTVLIVSLLAAGLLWLNVRTAVRHFELNDALDEYCHDEHYRGWPWYYCEIDVGQASFNWPILAWNIAICLALLAVAATTIEWATRRVKRGAP